jgi:hypothetical protein
MATNSTSETGTTPKRTTRKRKTGSSRTRAQRTSTPRKRALTDDAREAVRSVRTRAKRAARKVPTDATSLSIGAGIIAGVVAAGVAIFMNRDRLRSAAASGGERLRKAADDLSTMAHERIDQARGNITRIRARSEETAPRPETSGTTDTTASTMSAAS